MLKLCAIRIDCAILYDSPVEIIIVPPFPNVRVLVDAVMYLSPE